jgi:putative transposase
VTILRQCELLDLSRSSLYYHPKPLSAADLALMRRIDELHLKYPFFGSRRMAQMLKRQGVKVGRLHVASLMRLMGLEAIYRKKRTSIPGRGHKIYPYLLRDVAIERPNQVWAADITYLPMACGFAYLVAIVDLFSRKVLAWRVSNAMSSEFCVEALNEALARYGPCEIFNTDQGSQFTDEDFTAPLIAKGVRVSMDGKGRWIDNVFVERLWRSVKYELIYLHAHESIRELKSALADYFEFFNAVRPHQTLGYHTPDEMYFGCADDREGEKSIHAAHHRAFARTSALATSAKGAVEAATASSEERKMAFSSFCTPSNKKARDSLVLKSRKHSGSGHETISETNLGTDKFKKAA